MAPRFAFQASKFRNIECKQLPREQSYDGLQVTTAPIEGSALAATVDKFAFAHQIDGGGAIQIKQLSETGKGAPTTPPLIRAHQQRVNSLEFAPFDTDLLASASADATVKIWRLPTCGTLDTDLREPEVTLTSSTRASVGGVKFHPSARGVVAHYAHRELQVSDIETQQPLFELYGASDTVALSDNLCALAWSYDGSVLLTASLDRHVRLVDPRAGSRVVQQTEAHAGRRAASVVWCGRLARFVTCGSDRMQERELKLWDPRQLASPVHRQRLDASIGQLFPLYDDDVDILYVLGKGDRSVRTFEVDATRAQPLDHSVLANMTLAAALLPKQACDVAQCEVARVLNLSASGGGVCDVLSFEVPRKDAAHTFQRDLFPDTKAFAAALSSAEWASGRNADPVLERVDPVSTRRVAKAEASDNGARSVFGASAWQAPAPAAVATSTVTGNSKLATWGASWSAPVASAPLPSATATTPAPVQASSAPAASSGWGASTAAWSNAPAPTKTTTTTTEPAWKAAAAVPSQPPQWQSAVPCVPAVDAATAAVDDDDIGDAQKLANADSGLSDKARRLGSKYGHKFKYIAGKQATRNELFHFGDRTVASSTLASPILAASARFWAAPLTGAGGPVMVNALGASGRASSTTTVLNGHKSAVTDMAFSPFQDDVLATGASDAVIHVWSVHDNAGSGDATTDALTPTQTLRGHTKGVRSVQFHPTAAHVLVSTAMDLSVRLWDVEYGKQQVALAGKLEDMVWNLAFSPDGALLATASRDKIVRVFDPRQQEHVLVAMGCGHDSSKPQFATWVDTARLVTLGVSARGDKQLAFWDARNLIEPVSRAVTIETTASSAVHYPLYDASSRLLFLVGLGDRHVQSYELDPATATAHVNLPFAYAGTEPISGAALLPKALCNVRNVEVDRLLLLTPSAVDCVSFTLPRTPKLRAFFQDDVYGLVPSRRAALTASEWFAGADAMPDFESLQPSDMVPLSQRPEETAPMRPKTLDFQATIRREDAEKRAKDEQFERLNMLAAQPSLHAVTKGMDIGSVATAATAASDSDDDWDD